MSARVSRKTKFSQNIILFFGMFLAGKLFWNTGKMQGHNLKAKKAALCEMQQWWVPVEYVQSSKFISVIKNTFSIYGPDHVQMTKVNCTNIQN